MTLAEVTLAVLWVAVTLYAVFAGADFGAGFWDLLAGTARRGDRQRRLIERSIGPVWEANHVWLVFVLVVLWTGFPRAFAPIMSSLYVPLTAAAVGIILRGAGFAFRKSVVGDRARRLFGATFAVSSVLTPFFFGAVAGAIASGRVPATPHGIDAFESWVNPTSMLGGTLAVATCAYIAAVFLATDADRRGDAVLAARDRRLALFAAVTAGTIALAGIFVLRADAPILYAGLTGRGRPLLGASVVAGLASVGLVLRARYPAARVATVAAVAAVVWGWAAGQYPQVLVGGLTIEQAAGSRATLTAMLASLAIGALIFVPALVALLVMDSRGTLTSDVTTRPPGRAA
ncbi:MAG: cytochrome bd ubiquinol oxidase subunit [Actinomycetota bacterium]|jgi:cytochrome d ubiquinol oxidase subunit II|nr:cytochrome bd ubiquinol oxidase subunit [Actinomycetota bacterium]